MRSKIVSMTVTGESPCRYAVVKEAMFKLPSHNIGGGEVMTTLLIVAKMKLPPNG